MSQRRSLALIPRTKKGFVLFWTAILALTLAFSYAAAATPKSALASGCDPFSIQTSDVNGGPVNQNHYASKPDVYLQGGPDSGGDFLPAGTLVYYQVQEPDGTPLMPIRHVAVGANGFFRVQLAPFDTTSNSGGEYKVVTSTDSQLNDPGCTKSDNFKVDGPGTLKVTKTVEGGQASGSFPFTVDCGIAGNFSGSIPAGGSKSFVVDNLAECTVTEGTLPAPPAGFTFGNPTYTGNPGTVHTDATTTIGIVNHLNAIPAPALSIDKGVSLSASGPFAASLTTEIGTTVHYRITVTNTGNVPLSGVTLIDNKSSLAGCTIPTTLAVGAHFDCDYTSTAVAGVTVNTATADSAETGSVDDSATVTGHTTPALTIDKGVGANAAGPFFAQVVAPPGTTVHYRITVTNTGNIPLTGVTLTDNTFDLVAKGCTIPTTLAVGASFNCDYSSVSTADTTTNIATADSAETPPATDTAKVIPGGGGEQATPTLTVDKTNNAPAAPGGAKEGDTVTFTLAYALTDGPVTAGTIKDVLPAGLTFVVGSQTSSGEFVFAGYDSATRTLSWTATSVTASGNVTYKATVDAGAAAKTQPLRNVATIDSAETEPDSDNSDVFVAPPPLAETSVPTAPRTDVLDSSGTATPGLNLGLVLAFLGIVTLAVAFVTPAPAALRGRNRRR